MSKNVSIPIYQNHYLKPEFAEFLLANGFRIYVPPAQNMVYFDHNDKRLEFIEDRCNFYRFKDPEQTDVKIYHSFYGFSRLNIFTFMLLLHITDVLPVSEFIDNSKMGGPELHKQTKLILFTFLQQALEGVNCLESPENAAYKKTIGVISSLTSQAHYQATAIYVEQFKTQYPGYPGLHNQIDTMLREQMERYNITDK